MLMLIEKIIIIIKVGREITLIYVSLIIIPNDINWKEHILILT